MLATRIDYAFCLAHDFEDEGQIYSAGIIRELIALARQHTEKHALRGDAGLSSPDMRHPELGAIHASGGHPEHVPSVYDDGRAEG